MTIRIIWALLAAIYHLPAPFCLLHTAYCFSAQTPQTPAASPKQAPAPLDINRATAEDFAGLPGIGPELGKRIVTFREKNGPFHRLEDLLAIQGIGTKKWRAIRPLIRVGN